MISLIPILFTHAFGPLLFASKKIKQYNVILILTACINLICNLILIPILKSEGAAITSAISQFVILIGMMIVVLNSGFVKISMNLIIQCLVFLGLNFIVFYVVKHYIHGHWMMLLFLSTLSSFALAMIMKLVNLKMDFLSTFKSGSQTN